MSVHPYIRLSVTTFCLGTRVSLVCGLVSVCTSSPSGSCAGRNRGGVEVQWESVGNRQIVVLPDDGQELTGPGTHS